MQDLILKKCFILLAFLICCVVGEDKASMRQNALHVFLLLTLVTLSLALTPQVFSQPENIKVLSYSWYVDSLGDFIVVGEIQNIGPNTIDSVTLSGIVYTTDGQAQAGSTGGAYVNQLIPQQRAPFYIIFPPQSSASGNLNWVSTGVDRIDFTVNEAEPTTQYQYPDLTIQSSSGGADADGIYWVNGVIQNSGTQTATTIRVIGTFYSASGAVIAVGYTDPLIPISLAPSSTVSFKVAAFDLSQNGAPSDKKITNYRLLVQVTEPLLSGTAPTSPPSTPSSSDNAPPTESPNSPNSSDVNPIAPAILYGAAIVVSIIGIVGVALFLRRRKH